jgi:hypothetical protein
VILASSSASCAICAREFVRRNSLHRVCSPRCAAKSVKAQRAAERADFKRRQEQAKSRGHWLKEAQAAFNAWIRARDAGKPCICCGRMSTGPTRGGEWDAGHYRSTGSAPQLRFDEANCHAQLKQCNRYSAGRAVDYRLGLIARIGLPAVEALEADQAPRKFSTPDLRAIRDDYRARLRALQKESAA